MPNYSFEKGDPVSFTSERGEEIGYVLLCEDLENFQALVGVVDMRIYRVPLDLLKRREDSPRIKNPKHLKPNKDCFDIGDLVTFPAKDGSWSTGRIAKLNPKKAKIDVDGQIWVCPYVALRHSVPIKNETESVRQAETPVFKPYDPVSFRRRRGDEVGHIAALIKGEAVVMNAEGYQFNVPIRQLHKREGVASKKVKTHNDQARLDFNVGDWVTFTGGKNDGETGRIVNLNPKYARVNVDGNLWRVPYVAMRQSDPNIDRSSNHARLDEIENETNALLMKHGLPDWHLRFVHADLQGGQCRYPEKQITLTERFALAADAATVTDTILHEIAHALVGSTHGHDKVWKQTARRIGCSGRVYHSVDFSAARWIMTCEKCGWRQPRLRRLRGGVCKQCNSEVTFYRNVSSESSAASE